MSSPVGVKKTPVTLLAISIGLALHGIAQPALAQQAQQPQQPQQATPTAQSDASAAVDASTQDATDLDRIVVVGSFRASLEQALDDKRYSAEQVDSIVAEDIGKFPDLNLAESLQRIPGVSIDRDAGEGRTITVRGLGQDFTRVRINGLEALATTGGTDSSGGANRSRGFDFNVFASDLFNKLTVRKTQSAQVDEGSLGATVDLRAARPFDYDGFTAVFSGQMGYNDLSDEFDPRGTALISNTWADGRFGALLSASYSERNLVEEGFSSVRWDNGPSSGGFCSPIGVTPPNPASGQGASATNCATGVPRPAGTPENIAAYGTASSAGVFHPRLPRYGRLTHEQERTGVTGSLQFRVSDDTMLSFDALYSKLDATRAEDFLQSISFSRTAGQGGKPQTHVREAVVDSRGNLVYGVFDNVDVRAESRFDELSTEFTQYSLDLDHRFNDRFDVNALIGSSKSEFRNPVQTTVTFDIQNVQGYSWDFREDDRLPVIGYPFDVNSASAWQWISSPPANSTGSEIRIRPNGADNTFDTAKLDLRFLANETFTLRGGVSWKEYDNKTWEFRRNSETVVPALPTGTTVADISRLLQGYGSGLDGRAPGSWLIPDLGAIAALFDIYCNCNTGVPGGDFTLGSVAVGNARGGNREISEKSAGAYVQLDFNTDFIDRTLRGNLGVRWADTEISALGYLATGGGTGVTVENEYDDWLPSLNLAWGVRDDMVLRFGAAKVMARPQLANLSPGGTVQTNPPTITIGNPLLEPFRATTYDFSAEWYFAENSLLSLALFYKDIDTYIQTLRETRPYNTTGLPLSLLDGSGLDGNTLFAITTPVNTPGGPLRGFEIGYQQPFTFLPGFWSDFGVLLNYTHVESEIEYAISPTSGQFVTADLVNLSPDAYNATLYYDNDRFSARVSASFRDDYLQTVPGRNNNDVEGKRSSTNVDFAMSYKLTDRFTLSLEGINLTDEFNDQFISSTGDRSSVYHHTGRQYYAGFRYSF